MDTPTLSPAGVGSPTVPPPLQDLSSMTDMVTELTRPVDRAQLDQEIEDFNLTYLVNVDDALNAFTLPPVAGTGTAPATTQPVTTATQTRPVTSTRTRPTTTTTTSRPRPVTSTRTRPVTTATTTTARSRPSTARRSAGVGTKTTTSTVTTPSGGPRIAAKQPGRRPRVPSPPSPDSSPPPSEDDDDDDDEDRRRGLRRRLDLLTKMLNNVLGVDVFATSRAPIQGPRSTKMGEGDILCAARPPERPAQVHRHHADDGAVAVAVAVHVDGVDAREQKKNIKTASSL